MTKHPINKEWEKYYVILEAIRRSGQCNMYGASIPLADLAGISPALAKDILLSWIENYNELNKTYHWQED